MTIKNFLERLKLKNLYLIIENDDLILKSKEGQLSEKEIHDIRNDKVIVNYIKKNKEIIIAYLDTNLINHKDNIYREIVAHYDLSSLQEGILFHTLYNENSANYVEQFSCDLYNLDIETFKNSWKFLLNKHTVLRTGFDYNNYKKTKQFVYAFCQLPLAVFDYSDLSKEELDKAIEKKILEDYTLNFDLSIPPLMRITLIKTSSDTFKFIWTNHHIIMDGWSRAILIEEFFKVYDSYLEKGILPVSLEDRYEDYINYINQINSYDSELFWSNYLEYFESTSLLPFLKEIKNRNKGFGVIKEEKLIFNELITEKVKKYSQNNNLTNNSLVQGIWGYLLSRYTGQEDILYGVVVSGRPDDLNKVERRIGLYINTLPLRVKIPDNKEIVSWLQQIQMEHTRGREYQYCSLSELQKFTNVIGDLFDNILIFENYPVGNVDESSSESNLEDFERLSGGDIEVKEQTNYLLTLSVGLDQKLSIKFSYNSSLLDREYVVMIMDHFTQILDQVISESVSDLGDLDMLTSKEKHELLNVFNDTEVEYPRDNTVVDLFEDQVIENPDTIALIYKDSLLTYSELHRRSNQLGHYLHEVGVRENSMVGICMDRSLDMVIGILAIMKSGGGYVPIDSSFPRNRILHMIEDSGIDLILSKKLEADLSKALEELLIVDISIFDYNCYSGKGLSLSIPLDSLVYVIYTSGSTGIPKGVTINHGSLTNFLFGMNNNLEVKKSCSLLSVTTISFDISYLELYLPWLVGGYVILCSDTSRVDGYKLANLLSIHRPFYMQGTPSTWQLLEAIDWENKGVTILSGGESINKGLKKYLTGFDYDVWNMYGPTETTIWSTMSKLLPNMDIMIGRPISNTQVYVLDKGQNLLPKGVIGELYVGGLGLSRGYLNRLELTAEKFVSNPFKEGDRLYRTGDLCKWRFDGNLEFIGRIDDQVKIRGYRIELGEIESVLQELPAITQGVVLAIEESDGNKRLIGYVVSTDFDKEDLKVALRDRLPSYMVPEVWVALDVMPLTSNGKVDRKGLPSVDLLNLSGKDYVAPWNGIEESLANIWCSVLEIEKVGIHDNFFDLGGHSLLAMRVVSLVRKELELEISVRDLFEYPMISELSTHLGTLSPGLLVPRLKPQDRPAHIPLSFTQERLWFIDKLQGSVQYHQPVILRLQGRLDKDILESSFIGLVSRHEILRTVIKEEDGVGYQYIEEEASWSMDYIEDYGFTSEEHLQLYLDELINIPYVLSEESILRVHLIRLSGEEHILLVMTHHIGSDGWSVSVMIDEFVELYNALEAGREISLAALPIQYADYSLWQREYLSGELLEDKLKYWEDILGGVAPLELSTDYVRPAIQSIQGASRGIELEGSLLSDLQVLCRDHDVTMFMLLLSVFKVLLYRYSGQVDICVGSPIAGRTQKELEGLIGFFINTLALRSRFNEDIVFTDLLEEVKQTTLGAYEHQDVPFEKIVDHLGVERDMSRSALFQVMFVLQNTPESKEGLSMGDITIAEEGSSNTTSLFDLTLSVTEHSEGLSIGVEYCTALFMESTIAGMLIHYKELLLSVIQAPGVRVGDLDMLTNEERHELLEVFNDTAVEYPRDKSVVDLFEEQVEACPDAVALVYEDSILTYQELNKRSNQLGHYLIEEGVREHSLVGICLDRSLDMVIGILGILKSGAGYVPIDPSYPEDRISYILEDTGVLLVLSSGLVVERLKFQKELLIVDLGSFEYTFYSDLDITLSISSDSLAYIIYTSGSTGRPKGVLMDNTSLVNLLHWHKNLPLGMIDSKVLQLTSISFDVSFQEIFSTICCGGELSLIDKFDKQDIRMVLSKLRRQKITHLYATCSFIQVLSEYTLNSEINFNTLKFLISAGDKLKVTNEVYNFLKITDSALINNYGPSESHVVCHYNIPLNLSEKFSISETGNNNLNSPPIGTPIFNTQVYILGKDQDLLPRGVIGELYIGGTQVSQGYLNRVELTTDKFIASPFKEGDRLYKTGDLCRWSFDTNLEFIGRIDDQVKIRGYRIELSEIESILNQLSDIKEGVVLAREGTNGNKSLVGYVVVKDSFEKQTLQKILKHKLPDYMVPRVWVELDALPLTNNGKIDKKSLPAPELVDLSSKEYVTPRNNLEEQLVKIWQDLLEIDWISIYDNFFDLGGHSLLAMRVVSLVRKELELEISVRDLFEYPMISELSTHLGTLSPGLLVPRLKPQDRPAHIHLSFAQERLWFIDKLQGSVQYHQPVVLRLQGRLDKDILESSFIGLVGRHELLRTVIKEEDGVGYQYIEDEASWSMDYIGNYEFTGEEHLQLYLDELISIPYELSEESILRVHLIRLSAEEHILLVMTHHIGSDGWSVSVMIDEFVELYNALEAGREISLAALPIQYADYSLWQRDYLSGELLEDKLKYWEDILGGVAPLELSTDYVRPAIQSTQGASRGIELEGSLLSDLQVLCRDHDVTMFMLLLSVFKVLLYRYSGQVDICVGSPIAGRTQKELEGLIGFFVNTLALRSRFNEDIVFTDLLEEVKQTTLGAYEHQDVPFEKIVDHLGVERDMSRSALFQVMFVLQNTPESKEGLSMGDITIAEEGSSNTTSLFDLTLSVTEYSEGLSIGVEYCTALFMESTIAGMLIHYKELLLSVIQAPGVRVGDLDMLTNEERHELLEVFNDTAVEYPRDKSIVDLFEEQVEACPDSIALVYEDSILTYQELNKRSNQLGHYLIEEGVREHSLVGICLDRSLDMVIGILGILKSGGGYVPMDPSYPEDRISYMLEDTGVSLVLSSGLAVERLQFQKELLIVDLASFEYGKYESDNPDITLDQSVLAYVMYTSGSVGIPKGVMINHINIVSLLNSISGLEITSSDTLLSTGSPSFDASTFEYWNMLLIGGKLILSSRNKLLDSFILKYLILNHRVTTMWFTSGLFNQLVDTDVSVFDGLHSIIIGGEKLSSSHLDLLFETNTLTTIYNGYGPTENTTFSMTHKISASHLATEIPIGIPLNNRKGYVLSSDEFLLPSGVIGELYVGGLGLSKGYLNRVELTTDKFMSNPFKEGDRLYKTGDLCKWGFDGNLEFIGRIDDQVKIRGYRIELGEIESVLQELPTITQGVVLARLDDHGDKRLIGYVVFDGDSDNASVEDQLAHKLPSYMIPTLWVELEELPLTSNGKVDKKSLPDPDLGTLNSTGYVAPRNDLEAQLATIWQNVLGLDKVGVYDNFFELGGHSLLATRVISMIRKEMEMEVSVRDLFEFYNVNSLAEYLEIKIEPIVEDFDDEVIIF